MTATLYIGSENNAGQHIRDTTGWPYSIYRLDAEIAGCDRVLCHGIQNLDDAAYILALLLNGDAAAKLSAMYHPVDA